MKSEEGIVSNEIVACRCGGQGVEKTQPFGTGRLYRVVCERCGYGVNWVGSRDAAVAGWRFEQMQRRQ